MKIQAVLFATVLCATHVHALPSFISRIPNGMGVAGVPALGHADKIGASGALDPFGKAFLAAGNKWTAALCAADSDGDGQSNGAELGDPCCTWTVGGTPKFAAGVSNPGDASSKVSASTLASNACGTIAPPATAAPPVTNAPSSPPVTTAPSSPPASNPPGSPVTNPPTAPVTSVPGSPAVSTTAPPPAEVPSVPSVPTPPAAEAGASPVGTVTAPEAPVIIAPETPASVSTDASTPVVAETPVTEIPVEDATARPTPAVSTFNDDDDDVSLTSAATPAGSSSDSGSSSGAGSTVRDSSKKTVPKPTTKKPVGAKTVVDETEVPTPTETSSASALSNALVAGVVAVVVAWAHL